MKDFDKEIVVVQTFYDRAYVIPFSYALKVICGVNNASKKCSKPMGVKRRKDPKTTKITYFIPCSTYGSLFGVFDPMPSVEGRVLIDDRGHIWPMINLVDGKLKITSAAEELFDEIAAKGILYPDILDVF